MNRADWSRARNVLCIRLDNLGDVLMTTPALRALKDANPRRSITLLTSQSGAQVAELIPEIDRVIVYAAPWLKATAPREDSGPDFALIETLREEHFDGAVIFNVFSQNPLPSALICYLANIPRRLAYCRENPYQLLTEWLPDPDDMQHAQHEVRRQLELVAAIGCQTHETHLSLQVSGETVRAARTLLGALGLQDNRPWVVIHPGASAASRRYPPDGYAEVAERLVRERGWQVVFTGSQSEEALVTSIRRQMHAPAISLAGRLSLSELSAVIAMSPLLITNNTGPAHIAAAVRTPVVDLYALTNPQHTPWAVPHRVLFHDVPCKYCYKSACPLGHHNCLRLVTPESVIAAADELLELSQRLEGKGDYVHSRD
jgi:lipopolysaccharide heptosyltransferase II